MKYLSVFFFILLTNFTFSQETSGILRGKIIDNKNNAVPNASISIFQKSTGFKFASISQLEGYFVCNQLQPANDYEIEITTNGFSAYKEENIQIQLGKTTNLIF